MLSICGWTTCCKEPTRSTREYHVFVYVEKNGDAFIHIRCADVTKCGKDKADDDKPERGIVTTKGSTNQGYIKLDTASLLG